MPDPFNLQRFVDAQSGVFETALAELRQGRKKSHWIWFVLPQLRGLGTSHHAQFYGIGGAAEAVAYLAHPLLETRLIECVRAISQPTSQSAESILGPIDALKFRSCLTLFEAVSPETTEFSAALQRFYGGARCPKTLALLADGRIGEG
ncbi:MAG: DUF1810 domain-containing protein [Hydrogenophaga sp.]|uniref:DUF1810 domain-containing protein n=1 Tax=Hydrogenophaga sp. TaxID=1904254 RepID=UPI002730BC27|nr:DUF1810 domain-containing protein [Hydrogenophaga sp.]MDP2407762.1 DUF1810 domain-containing protein [Hydrogenophaga sp.]MDZ4176582.1 DUF1810 domain-containing protein [Hydrogenophaga sp.]